jgi:uncharacterized protein (DUF1919 family)
MSIKEKLKIVRSTVINYSSRKRLTNKDFTIISDNCWGGQVYHDLNLEYRTPFVGLFIFASDYIRMLKNLEFYLTQPLTFSRESKFKDMENHNYPLGLLGDVELHFLHYKDEAEARTKWERRVKRINWDNLFIKMFDANGCNEELLREFDSLDFKHKVCFTAKEYKDLQSNVWFHEFKNTPKVEPELKLYKKYFDAVEWLNNGIILRR